MVFKYSVLDSIDMTDKRTTAELFCPGFAFDVAGTAIMHKLAGGFEHNDPWRELFDLDQPLADQYLLTDQNRTLLLCFQRHNIDSRLEVCVYFVHT